MTITLTPAQIRWLEAEVAAGRFASVDEAAQAIIDEHMAAEARPTSSTSTTSTGSSPCSTKPAREWREARSLR